MSALIQRVEVLVRVHCPRLFGLLRNVWWLLRWQRLPPQVGRGFGQDHAAYLDAMQAATEAALSRNTKSALRVAACITADAHASTDALTVTLESLHAQSVPPEQIVLTDGLTNPELKEVASLAEFSGASDCDVCLAVVVGAELKPYAIAALVAGFDQCPEACCIVPDHEKADGGLYQLLPWLSAGCFVPKLWAWRPSVGLPDFSAASTIQGLAHLPATLVRLPPGLLMPISAAIPARRDPGGSISVIVPTRDGGAMMAECVRGVLAEFEMLGAPAELLVVDNGSRDPQTLTVLEAMAADYPQSVRVLRYDHPFNYSAINNFAVRQAAGEQILLLNDDIQARESGWLVAMREELARPGVAAVGARLLYPNGCLQHAGVALGLGGVAGHPGRTLAPDDARWCVWPHDQRRQVSAVTGACLLTRAALYWEVDGLNEDALSIAFNDVDFCLKLGRAGGAVVYTPRATLVHHESISRGSEDTVAKQRRFAEEIRYMQQSWPEKIADDPFYSAHLSRDLDDLSFREPCVSTLLTPRVLPPVLTFSS